PSDLARGVLAAGYPCSLGVPLPEGSTSFELGGLSDGLPVPGFVLAEGQDVLPVVAEPVEPVGRCVLVPDHGPVDPDASVLRCHDQAFAARLVAVLLHAAVGNDDDRAGANADALGDYLAHPGG